MALSKSTRSRLASAIGLLILIPVLPFAALQAIFEALAKAISWTFNDRWLVKFLIRRTEAVERYFGVDAETEHREWQERRRSQRILTKKARAP